MRLLDAEQIQPEDVLRTFRHSPLGPLILCAVFTAPLAVLIWNWRLAAQLAGELPWPAWFVVAPIALIAAAIGGLCISAARAVLVASFLPSNWLVKTARDGVYLHLRSFQNHHFPLDVPTVAFLPFGEISSACRVTESFATGSRDERSRTRKRWIALTLAGADTEPISAWLAAERTRPAPVTRMLGIRASTRFQHAPVIVPRPGVVYVEWLGRALWRAFAQKVSTAESKTVALDAPNGRALEVRLAELIARGEPIAAVALAREERKLSFTAARSLVESVRNSQAAGSVR
jgi:hypothetical protein